MKNMVVEGKAKINIESSGKISKEMDVFYNPVMKLNRDISVLLLNSIHENDLNIADPLAGSGIRSIRFLLELKKNKIKTISVNDYSKDAVESIKNNIKLNKINKKIIVMNEDANLFLLNSKGFDYIDIDPFGTPNPFLDSAIKRISRNGILSVTATDTAALAGTYENACKRKYWAKPAHNELMHEIGLRILIRKIQLIGTQYDKALIPIFSYSKDHYMRVFLRCEKAKKSVDEVVKKHDFHNGFGPMWLGKLWDEKLTDKMEKFNDIKENEKFLKIIKEESKVDVVGFYDISKICEKNKIKNMPRKLELISKIKKKGYKAVETHFNGNGIRSGISLKELLKIIKN